MSTPESCDINRLPLGNPEFSDIQSRNKIYVDKTDIIYKIANQDSPTFFSRPRRFGKSLLVNTLSSLFSNGLEYFHSLKIEKLWHDATYHVVRLDFSGMADNNAQELKRSLGDTIINAFRVKGIVSQYDEQGVRDPGRVLAEIAERIQNNSIVLLIDEYDAPLTHHLDEENELNDIMKVLNNFYSTVKQYTGKFRLIFITGVTRVSHVSIFSAFNNILDLSLDEEYNSLLGFTQNDIRQYFDQYVENSAHILNMKKDEVYQRIEQYYDGFQFALDAKETVYNPWSILSFFKLSKNGFKNYWFQSGGMSSIIMHYLKVSDKFDILNYKNREINKNIELLSSRYEISDIPVDILLYQAGYFTIRKKSDDIARLVFPNTEVEDSILRLYLVANNLKPDINFSDEIQKLTEDIDNRNLSEIIQTFNAVLNDCVSILGNIFDDERSVRDIIYASLPQKMSLQKIKERETVRGHSDLELLTRKTHMIIEFKRTNKFRDAEASLKEAIAQIEEKKYGIGSFSSHSLYRVAMVISSEEKIILPEYCQEII